MDNDIFDVLKRFQKHPAINSSASELNLRSLEQFINGYETALLVHDVSEVGSTFNGDFTKFLKEKYSDCQDLFWVDIVKQISQSDKDEVQIFFKLLKEFSEQ